MAEAIIPFIPKTDSAPPAQPETVMLCMDVGYPETTLLSMPMTFPYTFNAPIKSFALNFYCRYDASGGMEDTDLIFNNIAYDPVRILRLDGFGTVIYITYQMTSNCSFSIFIKTEPNGNYSPTRTRYFKIIATALINGQSYFMKNT